MVSSRIASSALAIMNANHYISFTVLGIVPTVVSLIFSLGRTEPKLLNKKNDIPLWKKCNILVLLHIAKVF